MTEVEQHLKALHSSKPNPEYNNSQLFLGQTKTLEVFNFAERCDMLLLAAAAQDG